jgi:hypothetical protein
MKILRRFNTLDGVVLRVSTNVTIHSSRNQWLNNDAMSFDALAFGGQSKNVWERNVCLPPVCKHKQLFRLHPRAKPHKKKQTPWPLVRERTIPTERPPLVDEI